jgi:hypothetical protein
VARLSLQQQAFLDAVVAGSAARPGPVGQGSYQKCSPLYQEADFDTGQTHVRDGTPGPFRRVWGRWKAVGAAHKPRRTLNTLAVLQKLGARGIVRMDFEDARPLGLPTRPLPGPVLCYCRRPEASHVTLWPLAGYHDIGTQRFLGKTPPDDVPFADKLDVVVWRGALSGKSRPLEGGGRNTMRLLADLTAAQDENEGAAVVAELRRNVRFGLVDRYAATPGFDVGLTCDDSIASVLHQAGQGHVVQPWRPMSYQRQFRYILSVRGNDTGSNLIPALDSNSVVLREEDGWELFYSAVLRPWEHYIPLAPLLADLDEKLDWARANPVECAAISARARALCALLGDAGLRQIHLQAVYDQYRAMQGLNFGADPGE